MCVFTETMLEPTHSAPPDCASASCAAGKSGDASPQGLPHRLWPGRRRSARGELNLARLGMLFGIGACGSCWHQQKHHNLVLDDSSSLVAEGAVEARHTNRYKWRLPRKGQNAGQDLPRKAGKTIGSSRIPAAEGGTQGMSSVEIHVALAAVLAHLGDALALSCFQGGEFALVAWPAAADAPPSLRRTRAAPATALRMLHLTPCESSERQKGVASTAGLGHALVAAPDKVRFGPSSVIVHCCSFLELRAREHINGQGTLARAAHEGFALLTLAGSGYCSKVFAGLRELCRLLLAPEVVKMRHGTDFS